MRPFPLKIVTPDGLIYDGNVEEVQVRTTTGDMCVMARHINCVAPLGMGRAMVVENGQRRYAACIGGMLTVVDGKASLVATTFEWADEIDVPRALAAKARAEETLQRQNASDLEITMAQAKLRRALVRSSIGSMK